MSLGYFPEQIDHFEMHFEGFYELFIDFFVDFFVFIKNLETHVWLFLTRSFKKFLFAMQFDLF